MKVNNKTKNSTEVHGEHTMEWYDRKKERHLIKWIFMTETTTKCTHIYSVIQMFELTHVRTYIHNFNDFLIVDNDYNLWFLCFVFVTDWQTDCQTIFERQKKTKIQKILNFFPKTWKTFFMISVQTWLSDESLFQKNLKFMKFLKQNTPQK